MKNTKVILKARPQSHKITKDIFSLKSESIPTLNKKQILIKNHYLSIDPYMLGRISENVSYAKPQNINDVMIGGTVGEVWKSEHPEWKTGELVMGLLGWQNYSIATDKEIIRINKDIPISYYLGAAGLTGVTAWYGVEKICKPACNETIIISSAGGAVGSIAGQLALIKGCRVIGLAGNTGKCKKVIDDFGFHDCLNYKEVNFAEQLQRCCPEGIDIYFDNIGGSIFDSILRQMNHNGRISVCGMISRHSASSSIKNIDSILLSRLLVQGYIISDHLDIWDQALKELIPLIQKKKITVKETIYNGIESAPQALIDMLDGRNYGKSLIKLT